MSQCFDVTNTIWENQVPVIFLMISIPLLAHQSHFFGCIFIIPLLLFLYILSRALAVSKTSSILAPGLFQNFFEIRPDCYQASPNIARGPGMGYEGFNCIADVNPAHRLFPNVLECTLEENLHIKRSEGKGQVKTSISRIRCWMIGPRKVCNSH